MNILLPDIEKYMYQMMLQLSGKGSTKAYAMCAYIPIQDKILTSLLPETCHQASTAHMPLSSLE